MQTPATPVPEEVPNVPPVPPVEPEPEPKPEPKPPIIEPEPAPKVQAKQHITRSEIKRAVKREIERQRDIEAEIEEADDRWEERRRRTRAPRIIKVTEESSGSAFFDWLLIIGAVLAGGVLGAIELQRRMNHGPSRDGSEDPRPRREGGFHPFN